MKRLVAGLLLFAVSISGCTTKSKARAKAQAAFLAGQQQSFSPQNRLQTRTVWVRGEVRNQLIPWNEELTLSKAILAAEYQGFLDPKEIVINRKGETIRIHPKQLLRGEDMLLEPGDVVDVLR